MRESLKMLDKTNAKLFILNELMKKFEYLRNLEKLENAEIFKLVDGSQSDAEVLILDDNDEIIEKVKEVIRALQKKTREEIIKLEQQYFNRPV